MTKKDRIAISISFVFLCLSILLILSNEPPHLVVLALVLYWAYRFIKNDISFLQRSSKTKNAKSIREIATDVVRTFKSKNKADELLKWNELLTKGAITQEEYDKAKRDLLG